MARLTEPLEKLAVTEFLGILAEYPEGLPTVALMGIQRLTGRSMMVARRIERLLRASGQVCERQQEVGKWVCIWWKLKNPPASMPTGPVSRDPKWRKTHEEFAAYLAAHGQWLGNWTESEGAFRERRLRKLALELDVRLVKSRARTWSYHNQLAYMLVDARSGYLIAGEHFDLSLNYIEDWLKSYAAEFSAIMKKIG